MLSLSCPETEFVSAPLLYFIHEDDQRLLKFPEGVWFQALYYFDWKTYQKIAANKSPL